jgi:hypothetical protein
MGNLRERVDVRERRKIGIVPGWGASVRCANDMAD